VTPRAIVLVLALAAGGLVLWRIAPATTTRVQAEPPGPYAGRANPRSADASAVTAGAALFQENCTSCHGDHADGHGVAASGLTPPPADLRGSTVVPEHSDAYLFYRLSEGKAGTAMPAFRGTLDEQERWALVTYLRSLHPSSSHQPAP